MALLAFIHFLLGFYAFIIMVSNAMAIPWVWERDFPLFVCICGMSQSFGHR